MATETLRNMSSTVILYVYFNLVQGPLSPFFLEGGTERSLGTRLRVLIAARGFIKWFDHGQTREISEKQEKILQRKGHFHCS